MLNWGNPIFSPAQQVRTSQANPWPLPLSEFELGSEEIRRNGAWQADDTWEAIAVRNIHENMNHTLKYTIVTTTKILYVVKLVYSHYHKHRLMSLIAGSKVPKISGAIFLHFSRSQTSQGHEDCSNSMLVTLSSASSSCNWFTRLVILDMTSFPFELWQLWIKL